MFTKTRPILNPVGIIIAIRCVPFFFHLDMLWQFSLSLTPEYVFNNFFYHDGISKLGVNMYVYVSYLRYLMTIKLGEVFISSTVSVIQNLFMTLFKCN